MDVPSIQLVAAIVGGVGLGALLAAVSAGLHTLGEAGLQALSEGDGRIAKVAELLIMLAAGGMLLSSATLAESNYPTRPVRLLVGFSPGGTTDIIARLLAPELSLFFKQQFYVDNRPGATGNIAAGLAAKAAPDGSTLIVVPAAFSSNISVYPGIGHDPLRDFVPITRVAAVHNVLVVVTTLR